VQYSIESNNLPIPIIAGSDTIIVIIA